MSDISHKLLEKLKKQNGEIQGDRKQTPPPTQTIESKKAKSKQRKGKYGRRAEARKIISDYPEL